MKTVEVVKMNWKQEWKKQEEWKAVKKLEKMEEYKEKKMEIDPHGKQHAY